MLILATMDNKSIVKTMNTQVHTHDDFGIIPKS